jgi:hypothetical protein
MRMLPRRRSFAPPKTVDDVVLEAIALEKYFIIEEAQVGIRDLQLIGSACISSGIAEISKLLNVATPIHLLKYSSRAVQQSAKPYE